MKRRFLITILFGLLCLTTFAQNFNAAKLDKLFHVLESKDKFMGSIAVSENGKIIYMKTIGKSDLETNTLSTNDTKYRIGSISKIFTSCLIFKAIEEKKLNLDQTIDRYFPNFENAKKITISNLLNHRSGIHNFTNDPEYLNYNIHAKSKEEMITIITKGGSDFEPNSKGEYSNSNYVLLSYILEEVYKKPYKAVLNSKIIFPLGLKNTYFGGKINIQNNECYSYSYSDQWKKESETDLSIPMGAGSLVSNPTDLVSFINSLFSFKIVNEKSVKQMKVIKDNYGMGLFQYPFYERKCYGHTGGIDGFRSAVSYFPDSKLAVSLTSNGMIYNNNDILIAVLSSYYNKPFDIPTFNIIELKTEDLEQYLGEYSSFDFPLKISITKENQKIFAQATGQNAFPLEATEKDKFEFKTAGIKIEFNPIRNQMILIQAGKKFTLTKK